MKHKIRKSLTLVTILLLFAWVIGYFWGTRFEAYDVAVGVVKSDPLVAEHIGRDLSARIALFDGYHVSGSGTDASAQYRLVVKGSKGSGIVDLALSREVGRWKLLEGSLAVEDGPSVALQPRAIGR
jgi:hypothetical protein